MNDTRLRKITNCLPKLSQFPRHSIGYDFSIQDSSHLSIYCNGIIRQAICPTCYENALCWDNFHNDDRETNLYAKCEKCDVLIHVDNILVGDRAERKIK